MRRYILQPLGIEIFFMDGSSLFFVFSNKECPTKLGDLLIDMKSNSTINLKNQTKQWIPEKLLEVSKINKKWKNNEVSNF